MTRRELFNLAPVLGALPFIGRFFQKPIEYYVPWTVYRGLIPDKQGYLTWKVYIGEKPYMPGGRTYMYVKGKVISIKTNEHVVVRLDEQSSRALTKAIREQM